MKKLLMLAVVLLGVATMAQAQEREKRILDLKNGQEVKGYVMRQQDGSWMVETESGDTFFYASDEVAAVRKEGEEKKVARVAPQAGTSGTYDAFLVRKGGKLINAETSQEIRPKQLPGMMFTNYNKMQKKYTTGLWLTIGGVVATGAGTGLFVGGLSTNWRKERLKDEHSMFDYNTGGYYWDSETNKILYDSISGTALIVSGSIIMGIGLGAAIWGLVDLCVGIAGLDKIAKEYNVGYADNVKISFGAQQYGYGLAIKF
ncbi:MAG: hypothetical protein IJU13_08575 [Bacteroidales bacterium]|nr:hypothetical protein [Bacteroidales bacterium]